MLSATNLDTMDSDCCQGSQGPASCSICMSENMCDVTAVKGCRHSFCYKCIQTWTQTKRSPACPLCNSPVQTLIRADGQEEVVQEASVVQPAEPEGANLDCLDHGYFLREIDRVLRRAEVLNDRIFREAYSLGRHGCEVSHACMASLADVISRLQSHKALLEAEVRFDPQQVLQDLYTLSDTISDIQAGHRLGTSPEARSSSFSFPSTLMHSRSSSVPRHADDYDAWNEDEDEQHHGHDEDYAEMFDEDDMDFGRTPGRRPVQRGSRSSCKGKRR